MAINQQPIFPVAPTIDVANLTAPTALTTRASITGTTGLTLLTATSTNGKHIDAIRVKSKAVTPAACNLFIWLYNGTTSFLYDEIDISAPTTPSTTVDSFMYEKTYAYLVLPPTYQLYVSVTVASANNTDLAVFAEGGVY